MNSFISQIARELYDKHGDNISSLSILFPSRRARLFFADALSSVVERPTWQPDYVNIDDLMSDFADIEVGDQVRLITELYKVYSRYHTENFDTFYLWGEILLADFDVVDKYLVDADILFSNISDIKKLESDFSYLTQDQREIISRFWKSFGSKNDFSQEQEKFVSIWNTLKPIYHEYKKELLRQGIAYTGMMHRMAIENIKSSQVESLQNRHFIIAGFNSLTLCEKAIFKHLNNTSKVDFYWDHDNYYMDDQEHEAGIFMRDNIRQFPGSELPCNNYDGIASEKQIVLISAPSDSLQCKYVHDFIESLDAEGRHKPGKETVIVLPDENLLMPTLYSLPDSVENVNVTMGYPLRRTLVYSFMDRLIGLQRRKRVETAGKVKFYHSDINGLLGHPFIAEYSGEIAGRIKQKIQDNRLIYCNNSELTGNILLEKIFINHTGWRDLGEYLIDVLSCVASYIDDGDDAAMRIEFISLIAEQIRKLANSLSACEFELSDNVYTSLLRRQLQSLKLPFMGEPLNGLQVMGMLETRCLDFENVLILSINDDKLPGIRSLSSFIPYNLRIAYGLPTYAEREGVYSYYFYRLLQRAKRIHLVYSSRGDNERSSDPSRYIYQLLYESGHNIMRRDMSMNINLSQSESIVVPKQGDVRSKLEAMLGNDKFALSPTAFSNYIVCPLKFYFNSVARIKSEDSLIEGVDASMFGNILHCAMELLYTPLLKRTNAKDDIAKLIGSKEVTNAVDRAIGDKYFASKTSIDDYGGNLQLIRDVVCRYINNNILPYDCKSEEFEIIDLENKIGCDFEFDTHQGRRSIQFAGFADRIDKLKENDMIRVVDYKTGKMDSKKMNPDFNGIDSLFNGVKRSEYAPAMQTMLYAMVMQRSEGCDVKPELYYVRRLNDHDFSTSILDRSTGELLLRYSDYQAEFESRLSEILSGLFDYSVPFVQCEESSLCVYCPYNAICKR